MIHGDFYRNCLCIRLLMNYISYTYGYILLFILTSRVIEIVHSTGYWFNILVFIRSKVSYFLWFSSTSWFYFHFSLLPSFLFSSIYLQSLSITLPFIFGSQNNSLHSCRITPLNQPAPFLNPFLSLWDPAISEAEYDVNASHPAQSHTCLEAEQVQVLFCWCIRTWRSYIHMD